MVGAVILLVLPLVMAGVVYVLLRWTTLSALLATGTALGLGILATSMPSQSLALLGRELTLESADRVTVAFLFFAAAGLFLLAWRFAPRSLIFPMGLGLLSLLCGALMVTQQEIRAPEETAGIVYAALLIEISAALAVFALQAEGKGPTRGGIRYLLFTTLALPGLLVTHWLLARYAITPDETELLSAAAVLLGISFAFLLGVVPFHTWVADIGDDSVPLAGAFVLTVNNATIWFLLLDFLAVYPWLGSHPRFRPVVSLAGLVMVIVGALLAPAQRRLGRLMGYAALIDSGASLLALVTVGEPGLALIILTIFVRPFGLGLMAAGLSGLRARTGGLDTFEALKGLGWKVPWSAAAFVVGSISLAGLPVSAGFVGRWPLFRAMATSSPGAVVFLFLASVGVMAGVWRSLSALLLRPTSPKDRSVVSLGSAEGWLTAIVVLVAIAICVGIGLFPQTLVPFAVSLADTYSFSLIP